MTSTSTVHCEFGNDNIVSLEGAKLMYANGNFAPSGGNVEIVDADSSGGLTQLFNVAVNDTYSDCTIVTKSDNMQIYQDPFLLLFLGIVLWIMIVTAIVVIIRKFR